MEQEYIFDDLNPIEFYGVNNSNLELIKVAFPQLKIIARGNAIKVLGDAEKLAVFGGIIETIIDEIRKFGPLERRRLQEILQTKPEKLVKRVEPVDENLIVRGTSGNAIRAKTAGQKRIVTMSQSNDIVFAIGPAGTGKTYTAVALAVKALKEKKVKKIVLVRPAVEAGESLGFLPGDLKEKIDPYLRPLYDALEDMIHAEKLRLYLEKNVIEIAPLAYMRGRTLNHAFIILDEAQNSTELQMKMFLTRLGMDSKIIVTGDMTQIDLPRSQHSGLIQCNRILKNIEGIGFVELDASDVVRHRLVVDILAAYEKNDHSKDEKLPKS